jgi:hypothetical protein
LHPEPVSPELVLVDPELARRERARLEEKAYLKSYVDVEALRRALETEPPLAAETTPSGPYWRDVASFSKRRLVPVALMCSLLANGFLVADLVGGKGESASQVAVRMVTLTENLQAKAPRNSVPRATAERSPKKRVPTQPLASKGAVEREVVSLILAAPTNKLPRAFLDPATGLVRNNVQVICTKRKHHSFLCAVRPPSRGANSALYVRYRIAKNGQGVFEWYGYKRS